MDVISHGFWGGISFGKGSKKGFLLAFLFGVLPDIIPFAIVFATRFMSAGLVFAPPVAIPAYVYSLYNLTHSLVISLPVLLIALLIWQRRGWVLGAWSLHIIFDIFSHDLDFFPTPYLWPLPTPYVAGIPWVHIPVFAANWLLLLLIYAVFFLTRERKSRGFPRNISVEEKSQDVQGRGAG